jgi:hypothetical protein
LAKDLDPVAESCQTIGAEIIIKPKPFKRPFHQEKRAMIVRSLSGEYLEIIEE